MVQEREEEGGNYLEVPGTAGNGYVGSHGNKKHQPDVVTGTQGEGREECENNHRGLKPGRPK